MEYAYLQTGESRLVTTCSPLEQKKNVEIKIDSEKYQNPVKQKGLTNPQFHDDLRFPTIKSALHETTLYPANKPSLSSAA